MRNGAGARSGRMAWSLTVPALKQAAVVEAEAPETIVTAGGAARFLSPQAAWWGVVAVFLIHGLVVSTWVSRIASVKRSLHLGDARFGMTLLGSAIGSLAAIPLSGAAVARFGAKRTVECTACGFASSLVLLALAPNAALLTVAMFLYGAMAGANDVAINAQAVAVEKRLGGHTMSRFHAMFSLGGIAGSGAGALFAWAGIPPLRHFAAAAAAIVTGLMLLRGRVADYREPRRQSSKHKWEAPPPALLMLSAIGFCIFLSEGAIADWTSVFMYEAVHTREGLAAAGYAAFSVSMTGFRLTGDLIVKRLGRARTIRAGAVLAACGLAVAATATGPVPALFGFAAAGAGFSSIIPIVFAAAGRVRSVTEAAGVATVSGIGYMGFLAGPPAIGFVSEYSSLRAGLLVLVLMSIIAATLAGIVRRGAAGESPLA